MPTPAIHRIGRFGFVNAYLVQEDDGLTLVDTGIPRSGRAIMLAAQAIGVPIVRIALTHAHGDHIGSLDELAGVLREAEVLISARDARLLDQDRSLDPGEPARKPRGDLRGARTRPTRTFGPGERIGSLEVIAAPGHTPGHAAFLDIRDRTLYCGDAYTTTAGVATTAKAYPPFPFAYMGTWDPATALASAKALRALHPARLAPGHGKVVEAPGAAMDRAIARGAAG